MKLVLTLFKILFLLALALVTAAAALVGYDRYLRDKQPSRYITPHEFEESLF